MTSARRERSARTKFYAVAAAAALASLALTYAFIRAELKTGPGLLW